jgi:hypothetical protein
VTGLAYLVATTDDALCTRSCSMSPSFSSLVWMAAAAVTALAAAILWSVHARPVEPDGETGWMWGLCALFVLGTWLIVGGFPTRTCPAGVRLDTNFDLCIDVARARRFAATNRAMPKDLAMLGTLVIGLTAVRWRRGVAVGAPIAAATWLFGVGWLLVDTFGG